VIAGEASETLQGRKVQKRIRGTATQSHEGPNSVRGSVGGPERRLYTGALRGGPAQTVRQMVYCVGQAEHPAGLHTGQSNLPNRLGM